MNDTGKSHFLMKNSGLPEKRLDDLRLHIAGDLSQYRVLQGLMMRMGKQDQVGHHHEWAWHADQYDEDEDYDDWYDAYYDDASEWGYDETYEWTATSDGEWYCQDYDDTWAQYDDQGNLLECIEADISSDTYYGKGQERGKDKYRKGRGRGGFRRRFSKGKGSDKGSK
eukprot:5036911-Pyramimonas_sp.AAC.1